MDNYHDEVFDTMLEMRRLVASMETKVWRIAEQAEDEQQRALEEAAALIREGGVVAFPTETVYGLGADATSTAAVERIYTAKGRPSDNPLIAHIADQAQADALAERISPTERALMARLWPGPLTLVLPARPGAVSPRVTAGLDTVAVRMPAHDLALRLIRAAGRPLAAPSANRSGRPSPTRAAHVLDDLAGRIAGVLDGGPAGIGLESTVIRVDEASGRIHLLRPGGVTAAQLREVAPHMAIVDRSDTERIAQEHVPQSPGMKYTHYAPQGKLIIVRPALTAADDVDAQERVVDRIRQELQRYAASGETTGVLTFHSTPSTYHADIVIACGTAGDYGEAARRLYAALRQFDEAGATVILAESLAEEGIGRAIMNRLHKAAGHQIIEA